MTSPTTAASPPSSSSSSSSSYRSYPERWGMLAATALMTVANNILWISFASVNTQAADYYDKSGADIDLMTTISFIIGIPVCAASTWIVNNMGLRFSVYFCTCVTFAGGLLRFFSTLPFVRDEVSLDAQYWMGLVAQAITGVGNPIAVSLPTKVSQHWFPERETVPATAVLALALPVGISLGYGVTTVFVETASDVPTMNWAWFVPACVSLVVTAAFVRRSKPPSPPSKSAEVDQHSMPYLQSMKNLLTNRNYLIMAGCLGGAVGFFNAFLTLLQKILCSRGYENWFSGLCGSLLLGTGFIGAMVSGSVVEWTGLLEETTKVAFSFAALSGILITEFARKSDMEAAIAIACSMFGVFGFGAYPLALELSVEATYPIDEAAGTALIFLSGQIQGVILVFVAEWMEQELSSEAQKIETCTELGGGDDFFEGKDHTNFLMLLCVYITVLGSVFVLFFHTDYKRRRANRERERKQEEEEEGEVAKELNGISL